MKLVGYIEYVCVRERNKRKMEEKQTGVKTFEKLEKKIRKIPIQKKKNCLQD